VRPTSGADDAGAGVTAPGATVRGICRAIAGALAVLFLASVARFYHPVYGFTALIGFPEGPGTELPVLQTLDVYRHPAWASYDGQFYAQLALVPLLRDPAIDAALDLPAYRARRILFSWTAWALGLGRPAWILQAFALQNVLCWLILAVLMTRWLPLDSPRHLALWIACLFTHGLMWSVRFALLDGPSVLLIACAIAAVERGRQLTAATILGVAGLGRETNLLGAVSLRLPSSRRDWIRFAAAIAVIVLPLLIWQDYLRSIYRSTSTVGQDQLDVPIMVYVQTWRVTLARVQTAGVLSLAGFALAVIVSLTVQAAYLVYRREYRLPWWRVAVAYAVLMLLVHQVVWGGYPGAITRIVLPMVFGFNVLLAREAGWRFWPWFVAGNLHLIPAVTVLQMLDWFR
jgi:hypothetical protein